VPDFTATGAIIGSAWATPEAVAAKLGELAQAGAAEPELVPGEHLVDVRFRFEAADENDAQDVANRIMMQAATSFGWMVTEIAADEEEDDAQGADGGRPLEHGPDA
jgi:hypothetical protein